MNLSELIDAFNNTYELESTIRGSKVINFNKRQLALILSKTVSDLQKRLGAIKTSSSYTSTANVMYKDISSSFLSPDLVTYDGYPLEKSSPEWIRSQNAISQGQTGTPGYYAIENLSATSRLLFFPTPDESGKSIILYGTFNMGLYSPSASTNDIGTFDGNTFSGNTVFPTVYDHALILGMIKQVIKAKDTESDYEKEVNLLKIKQYNGEKFEYSYDDGLETNDFQGIIVPGGSNMLNEDFPWKEIRFSADYDTHVVSEDFSKVFVSAPTAVDNGTRIIITSSEGEFTDKTIIETNNANADAYQVVGSESTTIYVDYYGNDYGTMVIIIKVY